MYGFMINVDWFQPLKHRQYSVGVIYVAFMNLPKEIHFKRENVIIVGLIPGPKEPPEVINSYLIPLVCELLKLWSGVCLQISDEITIRGALLCVGCDLPAGKRPADFSVTWLIWGAHDVTSHLQVKMGVETFLVHQNRYGQQEAISSTVEM